MGLSFIRQQGGVIGQDNPPPKVQKMVLLPPLEKSRSGQYSPLYKNPGQDKNDPLQNFCARSALKTKFLGLSWPKNFPRSGHSPLKKVNFCRYPPSKKILGQDSYPSPTTPDLADVCFSSGIDSNQGDEHFRWHQKAPFLSFCHGGQSHYFKLEKLSF